MTAEALDVADAPPTVWFAHWLRAGSVLIVLFVHLTYNFWQLNAESAEAVHLDPLPAGLVDRGAHLVVGPERFHYWYGNLAVGLFFLVSGLLIPLTLSNKSIGRFVFARIMRVYPVWLASLALIAAILVYRSVTTGTPVDVTWGTWLANASAMPDLTAAPLLNPPGWTLMVELKFYLLCALLAGTSVLRRPFGIAGIAVAWAAFGAATWQNFNAFAAEHRTLWIVGQAIAWAAPHLCIILIGVCFYHHLFRGWCTLRTACTSGACFIAMVLAATNIDDQSKHQPTKLVAYVTAVAIFALAYRLRHLFRPNRVVEKLADMCFSLYCVHFVVGIFLIDALVRIPGVPLASTIAAAALVILLSLVVHQLVERPGISFGKQAWRRAKPAPVT